MKAKDKTEPKKTTTLARESSLVPTVIKLATEIRDLIEAARDRVSMTANLVLVSLYWNTGRIIAQDIQKNEKRAEYGAELMEQLAAILTRDYGQGYSVHNLRDMKRFFDAFVIRQTPSAESAVLENCRPLVGKFLSDQIVQTASGESRVRQICQTASSKFGRREIRQTVSAESCGRLLIDFRKHFRLGWSHYRLLLGQRDPLCRKFYFEQAAEQCWPVRELQRQMDRGLFEQVALSKDTSRLVTQEKRAGRAGENEPVGLILCTSARRQHVELLLRHGPHKVKVAEYLTRLPDKRLLEGRLKMYSKLLKERKP